MGSRFYLGFAFKTLNILLDRRESSIFYATVPILQQRWRGDSVMMAHTNDSITVVNLDDTKRFQTNAPIGPTSPTVIQR